MVMSVREFRRRRGQASILLGKVFELPQERRGEGWRIYRMWRDWVITYGDALELLRRLKEEGLSEGR